MAVQDNAGRIHKTTFVISTSVLLGLSLLAMATRFLIRFKVQKQPFGSDDALLLVAAACLVSGIVIMYREELARIYLAMALQIGLPGLVLPADFLYQMSESHKWVTISLMLCWTSIMAVKFSFLFFFRRLIDRIQSLLVCWWVFTVYNVGVLGYGIAVYYIACPFYFNPRELTCDSGTYERAVKANAVAQMTLDIVGDLMILSIPICVIWQIKVRWFQKIALMFSLCLTIFLIVITIIRVSGLLYKGTVDQLWETYWTFLSSEVGVFIASAASFRSFFVAQKNSRRYHSRYSIKRFFKESWSKKFNREEMDSVDYLGLPPAPQAHLTGMRTFIDAQGKTQLTQTDTTSEFQEARDTIPLYPYAAHVK